MAAISNIHFRLAMLAGSCWTLAGGYQARQLHAPRMGRSKCCAEEADAAAGSFASF